MFSFAEGLIPSDFLKRVTLTVTDKLRNDFYVIIGLSKWWVQRTS